MTKPSPLQLALGVGALVLFIAAAIWLATWDPFGSKQRLRNTAQTATQQSAVDTATTKAVDHYTHDVTVIHEKAARDVETIRSAPTASDKLDPGFRDALCAAGLCEPTESADDHGSKHLP